MAIDIFYKLTSWKAKKFDSKHLLQSQIFSNGKILQQ